MSTTNAAVVGVLRNVKYVAASRYRDGETAAVVSFELGGTEIRLSMPDARALSAVLPNLLAEHSVTVAIGPLWRVA
ncbi:MULTISPECIES: hypothetical protein [unclassified Nocardia]|uniref:hypothetical protein n=1 Tax=unclassified Nocardia TaxID=2637762 RepID=UPI001CE45416|nr:MULTISPECIES: hypothetical protein [unclassified Nocardia]